MRDSFRTANQNWYSFSATLTTRGRDTKNPDGQLYSVTLIPDQVVEFWYENKANNLLPTATITYLDTAGTVDKFSSYQYVYVSVTLGRKEIKTSGQTQLEKDVDGENFIFDFWLDNIEIKESDVGNVLYVLHLVHANSLNLNRITKYSSYPYQKNITTIISELMGESQANVKFDQKSFEMNRSTVMIPYISNGTDTIYDAIRYCQNRQFYEKKHDEALKLITFNDRTKSYHMFDFYNKSEWQTARSFKIAMMKTHGDPFQTTEGANMAFVCNKPNMDIYKSQFPRVMMTFDLESNSFSKWDVESKQILNTTVTNGPNNRVENEDDGGYYTTTQSYWNNTQTMFLEQIENMVDNGGLKINVNGVVGIVPGDVIGVEISYDGEEMNQNGQIRQNYENKFKSFSGDWFASRVVYRVRPRECKFRQIISLMRTEDVDTINL